MVERASRHRSRKPNGQRGLKKSLNGRWSAAPSGASAPADGGYLTDDPGSVAAYAEIQDAVRRLEAAQNA